MKYQNTISNSMFLRIKKFKPFTSSQEVVNINLETVFTNRHATRHSLVPEALKAQLRLNYNFY